MFVFIDAVTVLLIEATGAVRCEAFEKVKHAVSIRLVVGAIREDLVDESASVAVITTNHCSGNCKFLALF